MVDDISRREFLLTTAGIAASGLAGCLSTDERLDPQLPEERMKRAGWKHEKDISDDISHHVDVAGIKQDIGVQFKSEVWKKASTPDAADEQLTKTTAVPTQIFSAGKAKTKPPLTVLLEKVDAPLDLVVGQLEPQIRKQLQKRKSIEDVTKVSEEKITTKTDDEAQKITYEMQYVYNEYQTTRSGQEVTVAKGTMDVEAQVAIWVHNGLVAAAGGLYPGEKGTITVQARGRSEEVSLGFTPDQYRSEVLELIKSVD